MNQLCRVCGEPAAGFHFGAFTCEGCKSFFGRTYNNLSQIHECKNGGSCVINKQNRTSCKACRLKKCLVVGMSKSGSKYGRRSNWFKIHCLLQEQAAHVNKNLEHSGAPPMSLGGGATPMTSLSPTIVTSLSPSHMTSLSPMRNDEETKLESSALSSPESIVSENSLDFHRKGGTPLSLVKREPHSISSLHRDGILRDTVPCGDFVANLGLYSLHPGLSLLHASQFYSRLYPPMLYPGLAHPHLLATPPTPPSAIRSSPPTISSPLTTVINGQPTHSRSRSSSPSESPGSTPSPPYSVRPTSATPSSPAANLKRGAEDMEEGSQTWRSSSPEQEAPIDLTVKRRKIRAHSSDDSPRIPAAVSPESKSCDSHSSTPGLTVLPIPAITSTTVAPVNLTKA